MSRLISVQHSDASVTGLAWISLTDQATNEQVLDKGVRLGIGSILIRESKTCSQAAVTRAVDSFSRFPSL